MRRILLFPIAIALQAQSPDPAFFESKIRPVLAASCYGCHSSKMKSPMGGLVLDTKAGLRNGGATGPAIVPGKPAESRLLTALRYTDPHVQMPPSGKLAQPVIDNFETWIAAGAIDPRIDTVAATASGPLKGMSVEDGRKWWAFQPVKELPAPAVKDSAWLRRKIDAFLLARLEQKNLTPSPRADKRTLVQRLYIDLLGLRPTYDEIESFVSDTSPGAYAKLVDRLLGSKHYGEAWGRHWLDVARYAEDNPTSEATNPPYPYAWRYRDWVIEALNNDVPYDRFIKLQLAADKLPDTRREDLRALGYLGAAPVYHKDQRLSYDVIFTFLSDDWDERVDAVTRGLLGLTVACARCHDHKFDPIPTKDYYGLASVFASTMRSERPTFDVDPQIELRFQWAQRRLFDLAYSRNLLTGEASTVVGSEERVARWKQEIATLQTEIEAWRERYPILVQTLEKYWREPQKQARQAVNARRRPGASEDPFMNTVYDAAQYVDGSDANYTWLTYKPGEPRDLPVFLRGNVAIPGDPAPRRFLSVLSNGDGKLTNGSGRLELAEKIFKDAAPLTARVIVNRVWAWHFGKPIAGTPSDFGTQGDKPTHPELLDDLAARFIANGWSLKWLHREILLSAAWQQASNRRSEGDRADQINSLLWRQNPRRLDIESYRDSILRIAGTLNENVYGVSQDLDAEANTRRTIYGRVGRGRLNGLLKLYDFPEATQTAPARDLTTTPLQQLFVMNGAFIRGQANVVAKAVETEPDNNARLRALYRRILARDPSPKELDLGLTYLAQGKLEEYAHILLSTNEVLFQK
ncbi:MAG: PSD1 domain-containing protein [Acidobacteria bacterium]|nr:PSD1 domain-containing protein [Acidobacteriota bacterium]